MTDNGSNVVAAFKNLVVDMVEDEDTLLLDNEGETVIELIHDDYDEKHGELTSEFDDDDDNEIEFCKFPKRISCIAHDLQLVLHKVV